VAYPWGCPRFFRTRPHLRPPPSPPLRTRRFYDRHPDTYPKYTWKQCYDKYNNMQKQYDKALESYAKGERETTRAPFGAAWV
jgi:hypothetical protein